MASAGLVPRIIVLALGAGALGFPDALRVLLDIAGRSPPTDMAICVFAMAVVTAQVLGAMLLARFVRKAARSGGVTHAHGLAQATTPRTDRFATLTLIVSIGVAVLVSACLLVAPGDGAGVGGLGMFHLVADVARKSSVSVVVAIGAAAVLPCARTLLRVFRREEDHSHGPTTAAAAGGSSSAWTGRFAIVAQVANFTGAAAFLVAASGALYTQRGSLVGVAAVVGAVFLARFTFTRRARNADTGAGGRAAPPPAADTRLFGGKLTRLAPYLAVVSLVALICCLVLTTGAPLESGRDGAKYP